MEYKEGDEPESVSKEPVNEQEADARIAEAITKLGQQSYRLEIERLKSDMGLISDAVTYHVADGWKLIPLAIKDLTNKNEVDKLMERVNPESAFYKNDGTFRRLVACLEYWRDEIQILSNKDSLMRAYDVLELRLVDDKDLLGDSE